MARSDGEREAYKTQLWGEMMAAAEASEHYPALAVLLVPTTDDEVEVNVVCANYLSDPDALYILRQALQALERKVGGRPAVPRIFRPPEGGGGG